MWTAGGGSYVWLVQKLPPNHFTLTLMKKCHDVKERCKIDKKFDKCVENETALKHNRIKLD